MTALFTPHIGLMVWTIVTFALLVFVLGRFGWKPLLRALDEREEKFRQQLEGAEVARQSAEKMKADYQRELTQAQDDMRKSIAQAQADAQQVREDTLKQAQDEARRLTEQARSQIEEDRQRMSRELRQEISGLSLRVAEKLLRHSMNAKEQEALIGQVLKDLDKEPQKN